MKKPTLISVILMILAVLTSSCFKKDMMKDGADDIKNACIFSINNKPYLIAYESVFQATSKSSGGGVSHTSGYNETRISIYSIDSGKLIARKPLGEFYDDEATIYLGCANNQIWFYSKNKDLKLYSLNALTLEPQVSCDKILQKNPELKNQLADPEWNLLNQFYGFDEINNTVILTDIQGFRYSLNLQDLKATKIKGEKNLYTFSSDYLSTSAKLRNKSLYTKGDIRKNIEFDNKNLNKDLSFIECQFVLEQNKKKLYNEILSERKRYDDAIDSLTPKLNMVTNSKSTSERQYDWEKENQIRNINYKIQDYKRETDNLNRDLTSLESGSSYSSGKVLHTDTTTFFVVHRNNTNKSALMVVSRISAPNDSTLNEMWQTILPDIFFNPSDAEETDEFKSVFSKGDPDFDFKFFDITDNKLVIIYMLHAICLDIQTGKMLWKFRI